MSCYIRSQDDIYCQKKNSAMVMIDSDLQAGLRKWATLKPMHRSIFTVVAVCAGIAVAQGQPPGGPGGPGGGSGGGGRGRGPAPKNLQVLQPQEVGMSMQMAVQGLGLGMNCLYCHVSNEARDLDDKPEKLIARKMFAMVKSINATTFNGENKVVCWTCHRGETKPAAAPPPPARGGFGGRGPSGGFGGGPGGPPPGAPPQ